MSDEERAMHPLFNFFRQPTPEEIENAKREQFRQKKMTLDAWKDALVHLREAQVAIRDAIALAGHGKHLTCAKDAIAIVIDDIECSLHTSGTE